MVVDFFTLDDIRTFELPHYERMDGEVVVAQAGESVPFAIARLFTVTAPRAAQRGKHAHRRCSQMMVCVHGGVAIACDDGGAQRSYALDRGNFALIVPPTIWNTITYVQGGSVLAILCDRPYEEQDYIRDYAEFLRFRQAATA